MNRTTSVYLDAVRLFAALVVVLTHLAYSRFSGGLLIELRTYGNDAVMVFFVLSGYVIAYTAATRDHELGTYTVNRLARLYSVALPAVLLTWLLDQMGQGFDSVLYDGFWYKGDDPLGQLHLLGVPVPLPADAVFRRLAPDGSPVPRWNPRTPHRHPRGVCCARSLYREAQDRGANDLRAARRATRPREADARAAARQQRLSGGVFGSRSGRPVPRPSVSC